VTTDKVDAEIPAPSAGMIEQILVAEGDVVEIGAVLAKIDPDAKPNAEPSSEPAKIPGEGAAAPPTRATETPTSQEPGVPATPVARRIADEASIDLREVSGTGSAGRITKDDVLRHQGGATGGPSEPPPGQTARPAAAPSPAASLQPASSEPTPFQPASLQPAPSQANAPARAAAHPAAQSAAPRRPAPSFGYELQDGDRVIPMSPMRKIIADHMVYSKRTSPHVGTVAEADLTGIVRLRKQHKESFQQNYGVPLTFLPFIVQATVRALREFPALNASIVEDSIIEKQHIHLGVATETEKGLVVPVIRDADRLSLAGTAMAIDELATKARTKKLSADDLRGGTFTVSNPGRQGNLYGFAIINQPQVGILRMGEIAKRPVVRNLDGEDAIVVRTMMYLALSYDHRAVDGAPANGFLYRIRELLEAADFDL
jgi:2-oxoglutarate dehydrogenase E2 component (dihydrolipoamide succinyltransferase)